MTMTSTNATAAAAAAATSVIVSELAGAELGITTENNDTPTSTTSSNNTTTIQHDEIALKQQQKQLQQQLHQQKQQLQEQNQKQIRHWKAIANDAIKTNDSIIYLDGPQIYSCYTCHTHLASYDAIYSKSFHGRHGRAYLFTNGSVVNISSHGIPEERRLITGIHTVCDIACVRCNTVIGWTYHKAYEASQKYKEGKYIIEKIHLHYEHNLPYQQLVPSTSILPLSLSTLPLSSSYSHRYNQHEQYNNNTNNININNSPTNYQYHRMYNRNSHHHDDDHTNETTPTSIIYEYNNSTS